MASKRASYNIKLTTSLTSLFRELIVDVVLVSSLPDFGPLDVVVPTGKNTLGMLELLGASAKLGTRDKLLKDAQFTLIDSYSGPNSSWPSSKDFRHFFTAAT